MQVIPFDEILKRTDFYKQDIFKFTRELIKTPSLTGDEEEVAKLVKSEMQKLEFDDITVDAMGNVLGFIGNGDTLIAMDGHLDVVDVGDVDKWQYNPFTGFEDDEKIVGRGATDMKGALASLIYAAKIIKDLDLADDFTFLVSATVAEEECDGLAWKYLIEEQNIKPEFVLLAEPSDGKIRRAQKGRMDIIITTNGKSAHSSTPEKGDNAVYKIAKIINEIEELNENLAYDELLGKGCLTVSEINSVAASKCSVPDKSSISIDRRLTWGETPEKALQELENLPSVKKYNAEVKIAIYDKPAYTGLNYGQECVFRAWKIDENNPVTQSVAIAYQNLFKQKAEIDVWPFSTNGVSIMGLHKIPVIGYGPGELNHAHAVDEAVKKQDLIKCTALYAAIPSVYLQLNKDI